MEYNTEKQAYQQQTEAIGIRRKVKRGDAWANVRVGKSFYNSLNQICVEIFRTEDQDIEHNFEFGRPVAFFRTVPKEDTKDKVEVKFLNVTGTVSFVDGDRMVVSLPKDDYVQQLQSASSVRESAPSLRERAGGEAPASSLFVSLSFDETSYRLMFDALERVMHARGNRLAYLRDLFYSHQPAEHFSFQPMSFPWLNKTQEKAVNEVLWTKDVMVVHGPPGTGKTTTLVEAINETLRRESQVLVCAQSNMAVDWISEQLVDRGIPVLRVGNPTRVNDKMLSFTYERRFEGHPEYPQLWSGQA